MNKRIVFAGGTDWSVEFLNTLIQEGFNIVGVLCPADSKKDRGQKLAVHALKTEADKKNIPVYQPDKLSDLNFLAEFKKTKPDLVVVAAYGKLFPKEILEIPPLGFINFHPSLLPKLRGPSPIQSAILEGFTETGVSIMKLGEGMDDGPILAQESISLDQLETTESLTVKLVQLGLKILPDVLKKYVHGEIVLKSQTQDSVTICKIIKKEEGRIDWANDPADQIDRKIRALNPQIKTFTFLNGKRVNLLESVGTCNCTCKFGEYRILENKLAIGTKNNCVLIGKLQIEGKNPISAEDFLRGYPDGIFSSQ